MYAAAPQVMYARNSVRVIYRYAVASCRLLAELKGAIMKKSQHLAVVFALLFGCVSMYAQKKGDAAKGKEVLISAPFVTMRTARNARWARV